MVYKPSKDPGMQGECARYKMFFSPSMRLAKRKNSVEGNFSSGKDQLNSVYSSSFSELELHSIKTAFQTIEGLWRDLSHGAEYVTMSLMASIHQHLGEVGSELFDNLFLSCSESNQV